MRGLGRDYEIMRGGIKRWPVGRPIQGPMHALHEMMREHGVKANDVARLVAGMPEEQLTIVNEREIPDISLQHLLAVMLIDGTMTFAAAHDYARAKGPAVPRLRKRIKAAAGPGLPNAVRGWRSHITMTLKDRRTLEHRTLAAKGTAENPLTRDEVAEKTLELMAPALGKRQSRALLAALFDLERMRNVRRLRRLYSA